MAQDKKDLECSRNIKVKRPYFEQVHQDEKGPYELCVFADASCQAYGTVVYLKYNKQCAFVIAKSHVKPLKEITLPRLELLAAFTAARLMRFVYRSLEHVDTEKIVLWSDSQIVLHWLNSHKKLPQFVENRVKYIRETPFTDFMYCPTNDNPADCVTRGISPEKLEHLDLWWNGPSWLVEGDWPVCDIFDSKVLACSLENSDKTSPEPNDRDNTGSLGLVIDISRYSTMGKLLRVTSYILRFIKTLRGKQVKKNNFITVTELKTSQKLWIQTVQDDGFREESLELSKKSTKKCTLVHQLNLFLDNDGFIRCRGRLENAATDYDAKYPLLLPRHHHFTELLVKEAHSMVQHAGLNVTTTFIRQRFWIPKIRQMVKRIIHSCVPCLKVSGKPFQHPQIPRLPKCRLQEASPFTITGVDFTGTLHYRTLQNHIHKAYICLFTCAVTRAIHLEIVPDMSAWTFLQAFRRFAARRSFPSHMISDNATTFLAAAEEIRSLCNDGVHAYLSHRNIEWQFIPKRAPWFGGFYERLIGITKTTLKKTLGKRLVTFDELWTLVTEIETVVNERPITYQHCSLNKPTPLTPSMLVNGRSLLMMPHPVVTNDPDFGNSNKILNQRAKQTDALFHQLRSRWKREYLPALRESHMHNFKNNKGTSKNIIEVGDVVLVHEDNTKRSHWPLAVVLKLKFGNDGLVRSAEIRMREGVSNRPINKLYPLEVSSNNMASNMVENRITCEPRPTRPRRQAAVRARTMIKEWTQKLN